MPIALQESEHTIGIASCDDHWTSVTLTQPSNLPFGKEHWDFHNKVYINGLPLLGIGDFVPEKVPTAFGALANPIKTRTKLDFAPVAQGIEQRIPNGFWSNILCLSKRGETLRSKRFPHILALGVSP